MNCLNQLLRSAILGVLIASISVGPASISTAFAAKPAKTTTGKSDKATIVVSSSTRGAKVYLNDQEVGEVPLPGPLEVKPGQTYTVRVQKRGYAPFVDTVLAGAGQESEVEADLVPTGGIVKISCNIQRSQVLLNGKPLGRTPFDGDIAPGSHQLIVVSTGYLQDKRQIEVKAGEVMSIEIALQPVPEPLVQDDKSLFGRWWFWGGIGAVVIGGVAAGVLANQTKKVDAPPADHVLILP